MEAAGNLLPWIIKKVRRYVRPVDVSDRIDAVRARIASIEAALSKNADGGYDRASLEGSLLELERLECECFSRARATPEYRAAFRAANPVVSVCVTTMNRPDLLLERCLDSLLRQTYRNLQIIVVGDHCTDDTERRVGALRDDRVQFANLGRRGPYPRPGHARWQVAGTNAANTGLSMAEGQFVTHLDEDDRFELDRIEALLGVAQATEADFLWHQFWFQRPHDGGWDLCGNGKLELAQTGTGMIFYHKYFKRIPWNLYAYRFNQPGDWNRISSIKRMNPRTHFIPRPLTWYYKLPPQKPFELQEGETFLD